VKVHQAPVSVVIAVHNGERYLAEAIRSVLDQTLPPAELLIVDDGSSDGTPQVCADFGSELRYLHLAHGGVAAALNAGIAIASSEWLSFLDADDLWSKDKLKRQFEALEEQPDADMVFGHMRQFRSPELPGTQSPSDQSIIPGFSRCTLLIRRSAMQQVGPFEEHWRVGEFVDWYLRAQDRGLREVMLNDILLHRRLHENNMGRQDRTTGVDFARIIKKALDRRRQVSGPDSGAGRIPRRE